MEVLNVSPHGIWMFILGKEYFLPHKDFPWFEGATLAQVYHVRLEGPNHLHWPDLDVDLEVDALENPTGYPLVYR